jgi:DMSO/TMAO reductase YedYZ molybdopterin-dependent catalytic subunit
MTGGFRKNFSRRHLFRGSLLAGATLLAGFEKIAWPKSPETSTKDPLAGGQQLGVIDFSGEAPVPMETGFGAGLDGRMYTDLSKLTPQKRVTPTESFYVRTRASELLEEQKRWAVRVSGLVAQPFDLAIDDLKTRSKPMGVHLMECAGNARSVHFGMLSVADWAGMPLLEILDNAKVKEQGTRVLVSGFDNYTTKSMSSLPGASWIFAREDLKSTRAFLATEMNGSPLTKDHGAPVRLVVPGWYGCACIKWVNEITLVEEAAEASSQMQEFAARTQQRGVPKLARDFEPATMDQAAMPVRIEKWVVDGRIQCRIFGILWGGSRAVNALEIRFNPDQDYVAVDSFEQKGNDPWSFWTHTWSPQQPGTYMIRLRVKDPQVAARRMDAGYYMRTVEITEV